MNRSSHCRDSDARAPLMGTIPMKLEAITIDIQEAFRMAKEWDAWEHDVQVIDRKLLEHRLRNILRIARTQQSCIVELKADRDTCFMLLSAIGYESEKVVDGQLGVTSEKTVVE